MWIWLMRDAERTPRWKFLVFINSLMMLAGFFIMVAGTYAAAVTINDSLRNGNTTSYVLLTSSSYAESKELILARPFSCADNSNSV